MIFGHVQSCCPELKSLTLLPSSHVAGAHSRAVNNKFFDLDSNLLNYVLFEKDRLDDRRIKKSAQRCITDIRTLLFNAAQYKRIFPNYLKAYGHEWKPVLRVCFLGRWKGNEQVWQMRDANLYPGGFQVMSYCIQRFVLTHHQTESGRKFRSFLESLNVADANGELFSRYDGVSRLFGDATYA